MNYKQKQCLQMIKDNTARSGGLAGGLSFALVAILVVSMVVLMISAIGPTIFSNSTVEGAPPFFAVMWPLLIAFALLIVLVVIIMLMLKRVG